MYIYALFFFPLYLPNFVNIKEELPENSYSYTLWSLYQVPLHSHNDLGIVKTNYFQIENSKIKGHNSFINGRTALPLWCAHLHIVIFLVPSYISLGGLVKKELKGQMDDSGKHIYIPV
jgi:hypothetical protein